VFDKRSTFIAAAGANRTVGQGARLCLERAMTCFELHVLSCMFATQDTNGAISGDDKGKTLAVAENSPACSVERGGRDIVIPNTLLVQTSWWKAEHSFFSTKSFQLFSILQS